MTKKCLTCKIEKNKTDFHNNKAQKDGLSTDCKACANTRRTNYYNRNKETAKAAMKARYSRNRLVEREAQKQRYKNDLEYANKAKSRSYVWRRDNRDRYNDYQRLKHATDINHRIAKNLRGRVREMLKGSAKRAGSSIRDLGCSKSELKQHLESLFQPGMTWDNYGKWHIDHIIPLSTFDLTIKEQFLKACHYSNLQPLWAIQNIQKSNKVA